MGVECGYNRRGACKWAIRTAIRIDGVGDTVADELLLSCYWFNPRCEDIRVVVPGLPGDKAVGTRLFGADDPIVDDFVCVLVVALEGVIRVRPVGTIQDDVESNEGKREGDKRIGKLRCP